jgi:hypothetical protein
MNDNKIGYGLTFSVLTILFLTVMSCTKKMEAINNISIETTEENDNLKSTDEYYSDKNEPENIVNFITYEQSDEIITLNKNDIYCDIMIPSGWNLYPNNDPSKGIIADLNLKNGYRNMPPSIFIAIVKLNKASDYEMHLLINKNNETNIKNKFIVSKENHESYIIYSTEGYNTYSSCLYTRYEEYCIYIYMDTETKENRIYMLGLIIGIADNLNIKKY